MNIKRILFASCIIFCCNLISCKNEEPTEIIKININNAIEETTITTPTLETSLISENEIKEDITQITTEIITTNVTSTEKDNLTILTIGDYDINFGEYRYYYLNRKNQQDNKDDVDIIKKSVLTYLLNNYAVEAMAQDYNITLTDEEFLEVKTNYENIKELYNNNENEFTTFNEYLDSIYCTEELYLKNLIRGKLEEKVICSLYEEDFKKNLLPEYFHCQHILFNTTDLNETEKEQIKSKAEDVLKKIRNGESFEKMVSEYNEDSGQKINEDGSVEGYYFKKGTMLTEFEDAFFTLKDNEVSELVETEYGYHIIKRLPITDNDEYINENIVNFIMKDTSTGETTQYYDQYLELANQYYDKLNYSIQYSNSYYELDFESLE